MTPHDAKILLKDKCIDALIAASKPQEYDPDDWPYLFRVSRSLRKLKTHLRKAAAKKK